jgi:dUTP pyrophosphatase
MRILGKMKGLGRVADDRGSMREDWADADVPLPDYATAGAAGADLRANLPPRIGRRGVTFWPRRARAVPTGLRVAIPEGFEMQIRPRSGLALKHGISVPNAPGTIDSDYRGPLGVILVNLGDEAFRRGAWRADRAGGRRAGGAGGLRRGRRVERDRPGKWRLRVDRGRLMLLVAFLAAVIWGIGAAMGVPRAARLNMLGLLFVAVLAVQVALPEGHPCARRRVDRPRCG